MRPNLPAKTPERKGDNMAYACQECRLEKGLTAWLRQGADGTYVCELEPKHRYAVKKDGFLHPAL